MGSDDHTGFPTDLPNASAHWAIGRLLLSGVLSTLYLPVSRPSVTIQPIVKAQHFHPRFTTQGEGPVC